MMAKPNAGQDARLAQGANVGAGGETYPWRHLPKRRSRRIHVGGVPLGNGAPIAVQTMTNTPTPDVKATLTQIEEAVEAGADLVRVSCPDEESTQALKEIVRRSSVPIIADIHFHYRRAIEAAVAGAACLRINPGNIGSRDRVREVVQAAQDAGAAIRIGVNGGSLERDLLDRYGSPCPEALAESAMRGIDLLESFGFSEFKVSVKASDMLLAVGAYRRLAEATDAPLHLGITEAGGGMQGIVRSGLGIGMLLAEGIGDTLRVSLTDPPTDEVRAGFEILKSLGLRNRGATIVSCPSCSRQGFDVITVCQKLEKRLAHIKEAVTVSLIGCVVNGPGEARQAEVGLTGGGKGRHQVYVSGDMLRVLSDREEDLVEGLAMEVERLMASRAP